MPGETLIADLVAAYGDLRGTWGIWLDLVAVLAATVALDLITRGALALLHRRVRHTANIWDDAIYRSVNGPLQAAIWVIGISVMIRIAAPEDPEGWLAYLPRVRRIALILIGTWLAFRIIRSVGANALSRAATRRNRIDATTADALAKLLRIVVLIVAALLLLQAVGVAPSALLAFSGVGGIAVGFAARDVLANIFGGLTIYLNRPFSVGDWIRSPDRDIEGVVEAIGWRATTVRRFDMRPLYVPNAVFSNVALENPSRMTHRRIMETVALRYDDAAAVPDIVTAVRHMLDADEGIDSDQIILTYLDSLGESALNLLVYCYTRTTDWTEYLAVKQSVLQRIQDIVREHDATIAYPTSTLHVPDVLRVLGAERATAEAAATQEEIDPDKVQSERRRAEARERHHTDERGPDSPTEEGEA